MARDAASPMGLIGEGRMVPRSKGKVAGKGTKLGISKVSG